MVARAVMRSVVEAVPRGVPDDGGSSVGATQYLADTFTDTNGTALTTHTMTLGPGWVGFGSQFFDIQSNATREQFGVSGRIAADAGVADGVYRVTVGDANSFMILRLSDVDNQIALTNPSSTQLTLTKRVAAADTVIVSDSGLAVITYPAQFKVTLSGNNITCEVVGQSGQQIAGTDAFNNTATRFGFGANAALITYDDFSFQSA